MSVYDGADFDMPSEKSLSLGDLYLCKENGHIVPFVVEDIRRNSFRARKLGGGEGLFLKTCLYENAVILSGKPANREFYVGENCLDEAESYLTFLEEINESDEQLLSLGRNIPEMLRQGPEMLRQGPEMLRQGPEMLRQGPEMIRNYLD